MALYVNNQTLELLGRINPHRCGPARPAASKVSVHSGVPNSSGAVAISIVARAAARPLCTSRRLKVGISRSALVLEAWICHDQMQSMDLHGHWFPTLGSQQDQSHHPDKHRARAWQPVRTDVPVEGSHD